MTIIISCNESLNYSLPPWIRLKSFGPSTHFLVASTVKDPNYRTAVSLGIPILQNSFLEVCRFLDNEIEAREEAKNYLLPRFAGVSAYFHGKFDGRLPIVIGEYGGQVVHNPTAATHIIVAPDSELLAHSRGQFLVTTGWIRESMDLGWMANEANFAVRSKGNRLRRRSAKMLSRKSSKKTNLIVEDAAGAVKYKRYQLCRELYMSEINCLKAIDFLIRISHEDNHLLESQIDVIFGSFPEQKKLHSELVAKLGKVLDGWNDYSQIGSIFVDLASQLEDAYVPYFQGLTAALELFKECKAKNSKFRHYIKEKEKDRSIDKQKVEYLLNIPMQQLTSRVGVTLKEILGKTDSSLADHIFVRAAIDVVDEVLRKCNNFKKESSESELIYRQVKNIPARILCSSRRFLSRCQFLCIKSPSLSLAVIVDLLLFEDVLMITRRNQEAQVSCATLGQKQKRAKFVDVYPMAGIREIKVRARAGQPPLVEMTLRSRDDCQWHFELEQEFDDTIKYLNQLVDQVEKTTGRAIPIQCISSAFCPKTPEAANPPSGFMRSLSSSAAVKSIRSYSQRLRRRINSDLEVNSPTRGQYSSPSKPATPRRPPLVDSRLNEPAEESLLTVETFNERSVDIPPPRPQTPPRPPSQHRQSTIIEADSEEEVVNPYEGVKFFSPLKNLTNLRHSSMMDEWC